MDTENIQSALSELSGLGMTDAEIGSAIGAAQSIVTRLRRGTHKTTSYERGRKILSLLAKRKRTVKARASADVAV